MHLIAALEKLSQELSLNSDGESSSLGCDVAKKQHKIIGLRSGEEFTSIVCLSDVL